jgi:hypothetical protein
MKQQNKQSIKQNIDHLNAFLPYYYSSAPGFSLYGKFNAIFKLIKENSYKKQLLNFFPTMNNFSLISPSVGCLTFQK